MHIYIGVFFSCLISVCAGAVSNHSTWDYSQQGSDWVKNYGYTQCGGKKQSPVNIADATCDKALNNSITLTKYDSAGTAKFTLENTGHSLKLDTASTGAQVMLGSFDTFKLQQLHFHWGKDSKKGSEHTLKGKVFPAEMHLVHTNTKYSTFNEAKTEGDGLAVLGVFIEVGSAENPTAKTFLNFTAGIMYEGEKVDVPQFAMNKLLPENQDVFYRYAGSLTTPTCDESVTWTVFKEPIYFSEFQLNQLRALKDEKNKTLVDNYRSVQDLNDRKITFWNEQECPMSGAEAVGASIVLAFLSLLLFTLN